MIGQRAAVVAALCLTPPMIVLAAWMWQAHHPLLPGWRGCDAIRDTASRRDCFERRIQHLVDRRSVGAAMRAVNRRASRDPVLAANCHLAWHGVGERKGVAAGRAELRLTAVPGRSFCDKGYVHGYLIGWLRGAPRSIRPHGGAGFCLRSYTEKRDRMSCFHAFGHTYAQRHPRHPERAARRCEEMLPTVGAPNAVELFADCEYGMWMQYTLDDVERGQGELDNCHVANPTARVTCTMFIPGRVQALTGSARQGGAACERYPRTDLLRRICANWTGFQLKDAQACVALEDRRLAATCRRGATSIAPPAAIEVLDGLLFGTPEQKQQIVNLL